MLEKLKNLSSVVLFPAAVLYLLGFVCITIYTARFGIVSFDIVNARFLIAGVFPLVSLFIAINIALTLFSHIEQIRPFWSVATWSARAGFYLRSAIYIGFSSYVLNAVLTSVKSYTSPSSRTPTSIPIEQILDGRIQRLLNLLPEAIAKTLAWSLLTFAIVASLISAAFFIRYLAAQWSGPRSQEAKSARPQETDPLPSTRSTNSWLKLFVAMGDGFVVSVALVILLRSIMTVGESAFDFHSFYDGKTLDWELMLGWTYCTVFFVMMFLFIGKQTKQQLSFDSFWKIEPIFVHTIFQNLLIPLLLSLYLFGTVIFPRIPFAIGGGEPRQVVIHAAELPKSLQDRVVYLLGETDQFLFIIDADEGSPKALQVNKSIVQYIQTAGDMPKHVDPATVAAPHPGIH